MEVIEAAQYIKKIEQAIVKLLEEFEQESGLVVGGLTGGRSGAFISPEEGKSGYMRVAIAVELPAA